MNAHVSLIDRYIEIVGEHVERSGLPLDTKRELVLAANRAIRDSGSKYRLHHDFETYCDANITDVGSDVYARHASAEVLMLAYACNDEGVLQWVPAEGEPEPTDLREMIEDPNAIKFAWNKPFEWAIWQHVLKTYVPHDQWRDPMVMAFSLSLPGSLDKAGEVVRVPDDLAKMKDGKALIRYFCTPQKPSKKNPQLRNFPHHDPEKWERFKLYNRTDVEAERHIYKLLRPFDLPPQEWEMWVIDQEINQAGIPININMANNAVRIYEELVGDAIGEMKMLTGLDNPNSGKQLLPWLQDRGYPFDDLVKGHVKRGEQRAKEQLLEAGITPDDEEAIIAKILAWTEHTFGSEPYSYESEEEEIVLIKRVLWLRLRASKASPKKYYALQDACDQSSEDVVLRNAFQFAGAGRTWRWSGRMFQAQNLPRPANKFLAEHIELVADHIEHLPAPAIIQLWEEPFDVLTTGIRPVAQAPKGLTFIDADLNAIENRVLGWIADCQKILEVFRLKRDPYLSFGCYLFGKTYEEMVHTYKVLKDDTERTISKPGTLGCGYMLGAGEKTVDPETGEEEASGLLGYAWNMGIRQFTQEQSKLSVDTFRREFEEVKDAWYALERAMRRCIATGKPTSFRMIEFDMKPPFCRMRLPSGRSLHYCRPRIEMRKTPWGEMKESITYEGSNDRDKKGGGWTRMSTHGGKIMENADQAISRDLIAHGMKIAKREYGLDIRIHVHDQIVALSPEDRAEEQLRQLLEAMERPPKWSGNGLPLGAAGHISRIFKKD